jgi:hypothetical protein
VWRDGGGEHSHAEERSRPVVLVERGILTIYGIFQVGSENMGNPNPNSGLRLALIDQ